MKDGFLEKGLFVIAVIFISIGLFDKIKPEIFVKETREEEVSIGEIDTNIKSFVHITGGVKKPGVYEIKLGYILSDLIDEAGGLLLGADTRKINLAMKLHDEMKIDIPLKTSTINGGNNKEASVGNDLTDFDKVNDSLNEKRVNINKASLNELMTLPGIGEKKAKDIISYRESKKFSNIEELMQVSGIGQKTFDSLRDMIDIY